MALDRPSDNRHRIRRIRFEIAGAREEALLALRAQIAAMAETALPDALSDALNDAAGPDTALEIHRLEVDIGAIGPDGPDPAAVAEAVRRALKQQAPGSRRGTGVAEPNEQDWLDEATGAAPDRVRQRTLSEAALDALIVYLRTGRPGPSSPFSGLTPLYEAIAVSGDAARRISPVVDHTQGVSARAAALRLFATAPPALLLAVIAQYGSKGEIPVGDVEAFTRQLIAARASDAALLELVERRLMTNEDYPTPGGRRGAGRASPGPEPPEEAAQDPSEDTYGVEAPNAGVVLLHPFLPRLFENCGLTNQNAFVGDAAVSLGARLVHYLATGETGAEEPVLTIPRLLCASPPERPTLSLSPLAGELTDQADALLVAAIGHWSKLGETSPDALRETFLGRPGLLKGGPERPRLSVEPRGVDILIRSLPWPLSPVRLPWMPAPLTVDWA